MSLKKYFAVCICFGVSSAAMAMENGFYLGASVGQTNVSTKTATVAKTGQSASGSGTGISGRLLFMGVQFNRYAAMELGYTHYAPATYNLTLPQGGKPETRVNAVDLVGKAIWPMSTSGISVFAKGGFAFTRVTSSGSIGSVRGTGLAGTTENSVRPVIGVGVSYDLTEQWQTDLTFTRLLGGGQLNHADMIALGITYHFTNSHCGQFLC